MNPKVSNR